MIQLLTTIGMAASLMAPQNATAPKACSLFTKAEVKKITGTDDPVFNMVPPREEPLGAGSACFYSGIVLQVDPFSAAGLEANRQKNGANWETVAGIGDKAYVRVNKNPGAGLHVVELYSTVGARVFTIQMSVRPADAPSDSVRPALLSLAKAMAAKLR